MMMMKMMKIMVMMNPHIYPRLPLIHYHHQFHNPQELVAQLVPVIEISLVITRIRWRYMSEQCALTIKIIHQHHYIHETLLKSNLIPIPVLTLKREIFW